MNHSGVYQAQYNEWSEEDPEGLSQFLEKQANEAYESYPNGEEVRYCSICGQPMKYNSMAYHEGYHFDSCL